MTESNRAAAATRHDQLRCVKQIDVNELISSIFSNHFRKNSNEQCSMHTCINANSFTSWNTQWNHLPTNGTDHHQLHVTAKRDFLLRFRTQMRACVYVSLTKLDNLCVLIYSFIHSASQSFKSFVERCFRFIFGTIYF